MRALIERSNRFLALPLDVGPRVLLLLATLFLLPAYVSPLWKMTMFAPQYPDGLRLEIYSYRLEGGNQGQDVKEINSLNHDIGLKGLATAKFTEFKWMPFVVGALALLFLRCAVLGVMSTLVDVFVLYVYFCFFSLWSFAYKLYHYGHSISPVAPVNIAPFMPPLLGHERIASIDVYSFPAAGSFALAAVAVLLAVAVLWAWRRGRASEAEDARAAG